MGDTVTRNEVNAYSRLLTLIRDRKAANVYEEG